MIQRDWVGVKYHSTKEEYEAFYKRHDIGVFKPIDGMGEHGIRISYLKDEFEDSEELRDFCKENNIIVEERIQQHEDLQKIFPNSVNTIRILTLKCRVIGAAIRMGRGSSEVDNASSGGIFAEVNIKNGVVVGSAMDQKGIKFMNHPTTNTMIPGTVIPYWSQCVEMVQEGSKLVSDTWLIGWDIAITQQGPTIVETNTAPGIWLIEAPNKHGLKSEFLRTR